MSRITWEVDPHHSSIAFHVRHMVIAKVHGTFEKWTASLSLEGDDLATAQVEAHIDSASINTRVAERDAHLRSADFLEVEKFPELIFESARVEKVGDKRFKVVGNLTLRGVTHEVTLDATFNGRGTDPWGGERMGLAAHATLNRSDFGLTWNKILAPDSMRIQEKLEAVLVGEQVEISIDIEAKKT